MKDLWVNLAHAEWKNERVRERAREGDRGKGGGTEQRKAGGPRRVV